MEHSRLKVAIFSDSAAATASMPGTSIVSSQGKLWHATLTRRSSALPNAKTLLPMFRSMLLTSGHICPMVEMRTSFGMLRLSTSRRRRSKTSWRASQTVSLAMEFSVAIQSSKGGTGRSNSAIMNTSSRARRIYCDFSRRASQMLTYSRQYIHYDTIFISGRRILLFPSDMTGHTPAEERRFRARAWRTTKDRSLFEHLVL